MSPPGRFFRHSLVSGGDILDYQPLAESFQDPDPYLQVTIYQRANDYVPVIHNIFLEKGSGLEEGSWFKQPRIGIAHTDKFLAQRARTSSK